MTRFQDIPDAQPAIVMPPSLPIPFPPGWPRWPF